MMKLADLFKEKKPLFLGPMAGYTNLPYRLMAKRFGADAVVTEMISAKGLYYQDHKTFDLMRTRPEEAPVGIQIFGSDEKIITEVIKTSLNQTTFDFIDFNAGCPAPKITKNEEGSALLKKPDLLYRIVEKMVAASAKPVTVKTRLGWDDDAINIEEVAKGIEAAGAAALFIHGRTRAAFYSGQANWQPIKAVKSKLTIPVVLNGDITSGQAAQRALDQSQVDGLMIGRAAIGNPFIFAQVSHYLKTGQDLLKPTAAKRLEIALDHLDALAYLKNQEAAAREMRKHLAMYIRGMDRATVLRDKIFRSPDKEALRDLLDQARLNELKNDKENKGKVMNR